MSDRIHECPVCGRDWLCVGCETREYKKICDECAKNGANAVPNAEDLGPSISVAKAVKKFAEQPNPNPKMVNGECCHAQCDNPAEFSVHWGGGPVQYTLTCIEHVGHLMMPGVPNTVYEYPPKPVGT